MGECNDSGNFSEGHLLTGQDGEQKLHDDVQTDASDKQPWNVAFILMILPGLLLADLLHPAILNRRLFESVNNASSHHYEMLDLMDCLLAAVLVGTIVIVGLLAFLRKRKVLLRLTALAYCCAIPICAAEAFLHLTTPPRLHVPGMTSISYPKPEVAPGVTGPSRITINQLGLRGEGPHGEPHKILCIGGSTTYCSYLDDNETWPSLLMQELNKGASKHHTWVADAGKNGLDLLHHIEFLKRCDFTYEFETCIVLCGVNDLEHAVRMPKEDRIALAPSRVFEIGGPDYPLTPHFKQAYLYQMLKSSLKRIFGVEESYTNDGEGEFYAERRRERQEAPKDYPLPPLTDHLAFYEENLATLKVLCNEKGLRLILVTQPVLWRNDLPEDLEQLLWSRPIGHTGRALSTQSLASGMHMFNDALREFCQKHDVELVDLAATLPKDATVFYDDEHFNEDGAQRVASQIAEYIRTHMDE